jgi:hypothetical protein
MFIGAVESSKELLAAAFGGDPQSMLNIKQSHN